MKEKNVVYNIKEIENFFPKGSKNSYSSSLLIDKESVGSETMVMNKFILKAQKRTYKGNHGKDFDEIYFILSGKVFLYLQEIGSSKYRKYNLYEGSYAFIKGGRGHYMINSYDEDVVLLTIMSKYPSKGVNLVYDERKAKWGTSFRLKTPEEERIE